MSNYGDREGYKCGGTSYDNLKIEEITILNEEILCAVKNILEPFVVTLFSSQHCGTEILLISCFASSTG